MYAEQIAKGAAYLDEAVGPNWPFNVSTERLDMKSAWDCLVAQLDVTLGPGTHNFKLLDDNGNWMASRSDHGFFLPREQDKLNSAAMWDNLRDEWIAVINKLRTERAA